MAIADDIAKLDQQLGELILKYEQYFIGLEKREPLPLLSEVEKLVRRYTGVPINNTMHKHRFNMLVARLNTYREHWNRILKLMEEGRYSRDRFISDLHLRQRSKPEKNASEQGPTNALIDLDRIVHEFREARKACNLPADKITRELVAATIEKQRPLLAAKLGTENFTFRVVIEDGKPKLKAGLRKH
ncbi:MAG: MXAN_5187 C-terminal domain-containing protein [Deltaproteobacteria bacterium]|nr:MXAN_5187 C-terminal domain-containing protein [Deltaproteobacteria bacterium]